MSCQIEERSFVCWFQRNRLKVYITMPLKQPIRDLSSVKCLKRSKDKSGEEKTEYLVLFDFVSVFIKSADLTVVAK